MYGATQRQHRRRPRRRRDRLRDNRSVSDKRDIGRPPAVSGRSAHMQRDHNGNESSVFEALAAPDLPLPSSSPHCPHTESSHIMTATQPRIGQLESARADAIAAGNLEALAAMVTND